MKDWIEHRMKVLRSNKTLDLYDLLEKKRLQNLQDSVKGVNYAKDQKNSDRSSIKQTTYGKKFLDI
jgi:hypothetical protein|tara:strand:+ start:225 stop:422 length:198 start_codon:yes stop_codon:yes gene_type:complete